MPTGRSGVYDTAMATPGPRATVPATAARNRLAPALERSAAEWGLLAARLRTGTPQAVGRGLLGLVLAALGIWAAIATWPALLPFAAGGIIAYAVFPLVDRLDRFMPRLLAAALATGAAVAVVVGLLAVIVPPLVQQAIALLTNLPASGDLERIREQVQAYLSTLPETTRVLVQGILDRIAAQLAAGLGGVQDAIANLIVTSTLHLFDTIGTVLGLVLLPIWILAVVRDGKGVSRILAGQFAPGVQPDALAVIRIVHRAASTYLRVQLAAALLVGIGVWLGFAIVRQLDPTLLRGGDVAVAAFAGMVQVIPQVGWILGLLPAGLAAVVRPDRPILPIAYLAIYLVVVRLVGLVVGSRLGRDLNLRAAIAVPGVVVISSFGLAPLLLSAPILVILRDLVTYLRGRLSEPPSPAGVIPGEPSARPVRLSQVMVPPTAAALYAPAAGPYGPAATARAMGSRSLPTPAPLASAPAVRVARGVPTAASPSVPTAASPGVPTAASRPATAAAAAPGGEIR